MRTTIEGTRSTPEGAVVFPAVGGGTNFQAPSYSSQTGWMYFAYHDGGAVYTSALNIPPRDFLEGFPGITDEGRRKILTGYFEPIELYLASMGTPVPHMVGCVVDGRKEILALVSVRN
jgi:hypothetical protein